MCGGYVLLTGTGRNSPPPVHPSQRMQGSGPSFVQQASPGSAFDAIMNVLQNRPHKQRSAPARQLQLQLQFPPSLPPSLPPLAVSNAVQRGCSKGVGVGTPEQAKE